MSLFKFHHNQNVISEGFTPTVYFLNEAHQIVPEHKSKKFVVKKRIKGRGFREFFGVINNPYYNHIDSSAPVPHLPFLDEATDDLYHLYGLDKDKIITIDGKKIPLYIMKDFLEISPGKFAGMERTKDEIAQHAEKRRSTIYSYYQKLEQRFVKSLTEVNCSSVAYLYTYLNNGEQWEEGMEFYGFVDGLWETGSYLTVSVDTTSWDIHTAIHELGHSVSYFLIQDLFDEWYNIAIDTSELPPSEYGQTEVSEDFAESFGFYFSTPSSRATFVTQCPKRSAFMKKLDDIGGTAILPALTANDELTNRFTKYDKVVYKS